MKLVLTLVVCLVLGVVPSHAGASSEVVGACSVLMVDAVAPSLGSRSFQAYANGDANECVTNAQHMVAAGGVLPLSCATFTDGPTPPGVPDAFEVRGESPAGVVLWRAGGACVANGHFVDAPCGGYVGRVLIEMHASKGFPLSYDADTRSGTAGVGSYWCAQ